MSEIPSDFNFTAVAVVHSVFKEKFAVPRQSGLAPSAEALIELLPPYNHADYVDGLERCSHIWLQFVFHQHLGTAPRAKVRPPRLGGNQKLGVFATRSPVRPNPIGLSVVVLDGIEKSESGIHLRVSGVDLVDGTPVLDIKPYVPYVDAIATAHNAIASEAPLAIDVEFSSKAAACLQSQPQPDGEKFRSLLTEVLSQDPRPQYQAPNSERVFGADIGPFNVTWRYQKQSATDNWAIEVLDLQKRENR